MNNGRGQLSAKEMTAEIEQATNVAPEQVALGRGRMQQLGQVAAGAEDFVVKNTQTGMTRDRAQQMGWQVLEGGQTSGTEQIGNGLRNIEASQEIARDEAELERPLEFVGDESPLQTQERLVDDQESMQNDEGKGLGFVDKIVAANQEAVAQAVIPEVNKIINHKSYRPAELMSLYQKFTNKTLAIFNRRIGDRN